MNIESFLFETFLTRYFLLESLTAKEISSKKTIFDNLLDIFCLPKSDFTENYFSLSLSEPYSNIDDLSSYNRLCRVIEFATQTGQNIEMKNEDRVVLRRKRDALQISSELFEYGKNLTRETIASVLYEKAMSGNINAMTTLAYMEYNGIGVSKDIDNAIKRIRLATKWNDIFGLLLGIYFDCENKKRYYDILYTILKNADRRKAFEQICSFKGFTEKCEIDPVARIIEKAFGRGIVKRDSYMSQFAKIAYSKLISTEDKEKLLLNAPKDALSASLDIPFDATDKKKPEFKFECCENIPLQRTNELKKIMQNIAVAVRCPSEVCVPLLIVASSDHVSDMYMKMLYEGFGETSVAEIDATSLAVQYLCATKENILLRVLCETKNTNTVVFVKNCEHFEPEALAEFLKLLDYDTRRNFNIFSPSVTADLSNIRFVLFANERNSVVSELSEYCDTVFSERITASEKSVVIDSIFNSRRKTFGCDDLTLGEGCKDFLKNYDIGQIRHIIDNILKNAIYEGYQNVDLSVLENYCREQNVTTVRRGFGFVGGNCYE